MTFGETIKGARKALNLSQDKVAHMADVSRGAYSLYEKDARTPPVDTAARIAIALGLSLDAVYGLNGLTKYADIAAEKHDGIMQEIIGIEGMMADVSAELATRIRRLKAVSQT